MKFYRHPAHGYHAGSPIGRNESTEITEAEFLAGIEQTVEPIASTAAKKLAAIRAGRRAIEAGGVEYEGVLYDSDPTARAKYGETARVFDLQPDLQVPGWKASDGPDGYGVYVTMSQSLLNTLFLLGAQLDAQAFAWERDRQAEVAAAVAAGDREALAGVSEAP